MYNAVYKLIASNNISSRKAAHLTGFRLQDGFLSAMTIVTDLRLANDDVKGLDCYVDAQSLKAALGSVKTIDLTQHAYAENSTLRLKEGNYEIELPLMDKEDFPEPEPLVGGQISSKGLVAGLKLLRPFLRSTKEEAGAALLYIVDGYLYYTDCMLLVRTLTDIKHDEPIIITKEFVDLCVELGIEPKEMLIDSYTLTFKYGDGGWIRTSQPREAPPLDFPVYCDFLDTLEIDPVDTTFLSDLERMCKLNSDGSVVFRKGEVTMLHKGKIKIKNPHVETLDITLSAKLLKKVLGVAHSINFSYSDQIIVFRGQGVEGLLSTSAAV